MALRSCWWLVPYTAVRSLLEKHPETADPSGPTVQSLFWRSGEVSMGLDFNYIGAAEQERGLTQ